MKFKTVVLCLKLYACLIVQRIFGKLHNNDEREDVEIATPKERYISPKERKQIIEELRLVCINV